MFNYRYVRFILFGICFIQSLWATIINIKYVPEFIGGLNLQQVKNCEATYTKQCSIKKNTKIPTILEYSECVEQKISKNRLCKMAWAIRKNTAYPINQARQYGKVTVFSILTLADGQDVFYMIDKLGQLINLTDDESLVQNNLSYLKLKKIYPNISLTDFVAFNKKSYSVYNNFPTTKMNSNKIELIFKQELRDGPCVGCKTVGVAYIAYKFYLDKFESVRLLKLERYIN